MKELFSMLIMLIMLASGCDYVLVNSHSRYTHYINPNKAHQAADFSACIDDYILGSYYGRTPTSYTYGKDSLRSFFSKGYNSHGFNNESGYVTIRFIVNCRGKAGRYILDEVGLDYQKKTFPKELTQDLLNLTQQLQDWNPLKSGDNIYDSYYHLTFKIKNGVLEEILP